MSKVDKIGVPYCQKVLPLVYDDSLSYYEEVCRLVKKVNELVDEINNITVDILDQAKAYTDRKVEESLVEVDERIIVLNQLVAQTQANFEQAISTLNEQYRAFSTTVNAQLGLFDGRINAFDAKIDSSIIGVNARTDLAIQQNNEYIFDVIGRQVLSDIKVVNYFTGELVGIQTMFDYLSGLHVDDGLTYTELAQRDKTINEIIALDASYTDLVLHAKSIIEE